MTEEQWLLMKAEIMQKPDKHPPADEKWIGKTIDGELKWFTTAEYEKHVYATLGKPVPNL